MSAHRPHPIEGDPQDGDILAYDDCVRCEMYVVMPTSLDMYRFLQAYQMARDNEPARTATERALLNVFEKFLLMREKARRAGI